MVSFISADETTVGWNMLTAHIGVRCANTEKTVLLVENHELFEKALVLSC